MPGFGAIEKDTWDSDSGKTFRQWLSEITQRKPKPEPSRPRCSFGEEQQCKADALPGQSLCSTHLAIYKPPQAAQQDPPKGKRPPDRKYFQAFTRNGRGLPIARFKDERGAWDIELPLRITFDTVEQMGIEVTELYALGYEMRTNDRLWVFPTATPVNRFDPPVAKPVTVPVQPRRGRAPIAKSAEEV